MKKTLLTFIPLILVIIGCGSAPTTSGAAPAETSSSSVSLDQAIAEAARRIDGRLAGGSKIAPLNFNSPTDKFSSYVLDELTACLVDSGKLTVVDRKEVDLIRSEFDFQFSGEVGDDSMQELGRMLGAQSIVSGSLTDMGEFYRIVIRVLNVQNASVEIQYRANITSDPIVTTLLTGGKAAPVAASGSNGADPAQIAQTPAGSRKGGQVAPAGVVKDSYTVGETGPAGGIIFYVNNGAGDWKYLEAAPVSTERSGLKWLTNNVRIEGTKTEVGAGKENTEALVAALSKGVPEAALMCVELNYEGFNDWFLPSKDELNLMYIYLKRRNLGGFTNDWYWSSSEYDSYYACDQNFSDGEQNSRVYGKVAIRRVRAIRRF